jgi:hypothetical protein
VPIPRLPRAPAALPLLAAAALLAALPLLAGCGGVQDWLDELAGRPAATETQETVPQPSITVPAGPQLYCISNIGHTLVVFDLASRSVLPGTRRYLDLDPVGPWFSAGYGYYLSRVETSGAGSNALIEFFPKTAVERRRMKFPANSNPAALLALPSVPGKAWVALRGSTFDNFATNAIAVVDLAAWTYVLADLNSLSGPGGTIGTLVGGQTLTSLSSFVWDAACPAAGGAPCVYGLVNNFDGSVRDGWVLVLGMDGSGHPTLLDAIPVGRNPQEDLLLDGANGRLWVVNNGGYPPGHQAGTVQGLNTTDWTSTDVPDGTSSGGAVLVGIHDFDGATAWVTTYPSDAVYAMSLTAPFTLNTAPGLPTLTGPLFHTTAPAAGLYAAKGGYGPAHLAELNPATGALLADHNLQSGNGPASCAAYTVP